MYQIVGEKEKTMNCVFCVEDDSNIRELIEYTLSSTGFEIKSFECGADFFAAL